MPTDFKQANTLTTHVVMLVVTMAILALFMPSIG
jgi:hypothetical protein